MVYHIEGKTGTWEIVIGLETHAQINSTTKLFSRSSNKFGEEPNSNVSLFDAAFPGQLPIINKKAVYQAVKTGIGINGDINKRSTFDRKSYFYPDLPQGYQITQFYNPIVWGGFLVIDNEDSERKNISIERIHIEQDAGKLIHDSHPALSLVDLNRAGVPLMEIVTKPDMRSPYEAMEYVRNLRALLKAIDTCDCNMEQGNLRCDANVSVRRLGSKELGTRCEIKNLNSIRNIGKAIEYESSRHVEMLEDGESVSQETRLYDAGVNKTYTMRSKEDAIDYRYFPDPDLGVLVVTDEILEKIKSDMPELPSQKKDRYMKDYGLSLYDANVIISSFEVSKYFESLVSKHNPKLVSNWMTVELFGRLNKVGKSIDDSPITFDMMSELLKFIETSVISGKTAKDVMDIMFETGNDPKKIIEDRGLRQVSDESEIAKIVDECLMQNNDKVKAYKGGQVKLFGFFVGQTMKLMAGNGNPAMINKILKDKLDS